jgi:hypothetical protein
MQNPLGTCLALGLIVGGFGLTGDLGRLISRSMRVIQASDVPDDDAPIPVAPATGREPAPPMHPVAEATIRPPRAGLEAADATRLAAGNRIRIWLERPAAAGPGEVRCLALDIVDPASREALVSEVPPSPAPGLPAAAPAPPRRAIIGGSGPAGAITRGGTLMLQSRGIAGAGDRESLGPIIAIDVMH